MSAAVDDASDQSQTRVKKYFADKGWLRGTVITCLATKGQDTGEKSSLKTKSGGEMLYQVRFEDGTTEDIPLYALKELIALDMVAIGTHFVIYSYEQQRYFHAKVRAIDDSKTNNIRAEFETTRSDWIDLRRFKFQLINPSKGSFSFPPLPGDDIVKAEPPPLRKKEVTNQTTQTDLANLQHQSSQTDGEEKVHQGTQTLVETKMDQGVQTMAVEEIVTATAHQGTQTEAEPKVLTVHMETQTDTCSQTDQGCQTNPAAPQHDQGTQTIVEKKCHQITQTDAEEKCHQETQTVAEETFHQMTQTDVEEKCHQETQTIEEERISQETQTVEEEKIHRETQTDAGTSVVSQETQTVEEEKSSQETQTQTGVTNHQETQTEATAEADVSPKEVLHQETQTIKQEKMDQQVQTSVEPTQTEAPVESHAVAAEAPSTRAETTDSPEQKRLKRIREQLEIDMIDGGLGELGDWTEEGGEEEEEALDLNLDDPEKGRKRPAKALEKKKPEARVTKTADHDEMTLESPPLSAVRKGTRLAILYDQDDEYYAVKVVSVRRTKTRTSYFIEYESDSYREWTILSNREFYILEEFLAYEEYLRSIRGQWIPAENFKRIRRYEEEGTMFGTQNYELVRDPFTRIELPRDKERTTDLLAAQRRTLRLATEGSRVAVWSMSEKQYHKGTITGSRENKKGTTQFHVVYDHGVKSWLSLELQVFVLLLPPEMNGKAGSSTRTATEGNALEEGAEAAKPDSKSSSAAAGENEAKRRRTMHEPKAGGATDEPKSKRMRKSTS